MKNSFKPLVLATAVAGLAAGTANAQPPTGGFYPSLGDAAFVPYYTVEGEWVTGVHIINTSSDNAVVVKIRLRRAEDSLDVLDFNLILSPEDVWTGTLTGDDAEMRFVTEDNSCTAPELLDNGDGKTYAPVFGPRIEGAQEGYIEVIGMGEVTDSDDSVWVYSKHGADGVPADCDIVRQNFFVDALVDNDETSIDSSLVEDGEDSTTFYGSTDNVLKVSYFIRDNESGIEFGNNAMHFQNFSPFAMMSHQQFGLENYSQEPSDALNGWDFPDVRGGGNNTPTRNSLFRVRDQLGAVEVMNDWSYNPATGAATDWVVTFPGQYALEDFYLKNFGAPNAVWDYREIPVTAAFTIRDREEDGGVPGGLNFSPSPAPDTTTLEYEVNVIEWGGLEVLNSNYVTAVDPRDNQIDSPVGWARLAVTARSGPSGSQNVIADGVNAWCDVAAGETNLGGDVASADGACDMYSVSGPVPMVGFAAWERTFSEDADRNYGRIVEHSFTTSFR
jgi:hypothetical protein